MVIPEKIKRLVGPGKLREMWSELHQLEQNYSTAPVKDELIDLIERKQGSILRSRPVLGANEWYVNEVISLGDNYYAISLEDGHIILFLLLRYEDNKVVVLAETT